MIKSEGSCVHPPKVKRWPYEQYYIGERDEEKRKAGEGEHHWTGAESLESYTGNFFQDSMHGLGIYRWRFKGPEGIFATYEGNFYGNTMHGYGLMSYDDGRCFAGLFHHDLRWGPGIESQACQREDVGLWRGNQLLRLTWRPAAPNVALDLGDSSNGKASIELQRKRLTTRNKIVYEVNSAIELLKHCGSPPLTASENWTKLYPTHCNDLASSLCNVKAFENEYYGGNIHFLEEVNSPPILETKENILVTDGPEHSNAIYYAWNNNTTYIHMMKHCYKHEKQRSNFNVPLHQILAGPRTEFKAAGKHEIDCRTVLMASYLGHITNVVQLVNEFNVHPDVTDIQGNNCIMYAACGDQIDIIHFLKEAGGSIDAFNDCCVTPLGITIMRYLCTERDIPVCGMVQGLIPPPAPAITIAPAEELINEWKITRDLPVVSPVPTTTDVKLTAKASPSKKLKTTSTPVETSNKKKTMIAENDSPSQTKSGKEIMFSEETRLYHNINAEFKFRVTDLFSIRPNTMSPVPYLFEVKDLAAEIEFNEGDNKKVPVSNSTKNVSRVIKPSKSAMWKSSKDEMGMASVDNLVKTKIEALSRIKSTIGQLLSYGADPRLVRCPQPALLLAVMSGCSELTEHLSNHGADVNERFPQYLEYSALDVAISQPLSAVTLSLARTLLKCGAECQHRLKVVPEILHHQSSPKGVSEAPDPDSGPTLLHAVLAKTCRNETDEEIRRELLDLLLQYNCDPNLRYKGISAIDKAININIELLETFVKCPRTDLNACINDNNETVLQKMFTFPFFNKISSAERLMILTNMLLYGADPFLECKMDKEIYKNLFVYAKKVLAELTTKPSSPLDGGDIKAKKGEVKPKKESGSKVDPSIIEDYSQALDLVVECARILLVRWLQTKLYVELLDIVKRYKHRNWIMILPEHKNKKGCGLWLSSLRCLEIFDIMKSNKKQKKITIEDRRVLRHLLCMVELYCQRENELLDRRVTIQEKDKVEKQVKYIMYEHSSSRAEALANEEICSRPYVTPELDLNCAEKYNVCFDCLLPLNDEIEKVTCCSCKLVSFCGFDCMSENIHRAGCHPCSEFLRIKFFPSPEESFYSDAT